VKLTDASAVVTGGASGLGLATARRLAGMGATVVVADLAPDGADVAASFGAGFVRADVTSGDDLRAAVEAARAQAPLRALVHCAATAKPQRILKKDGSASALEDFERDVRICTVGTFNALRLAAEAMAATEPVDGERGVCVLTASVAAFEGQIGQLSYAAGKGGVVSMTLPAARDLASHLIRVVTIAPGLFATPPMLAVREDIRAGLEALVPHPSRLGRPEEFADLAAHVVENPMLNGEVIRLDGGIRMQPR
jgi:NAD(P)-dependent dehydrogenase (short-subunit alcohol dehydrogenase family)